MFAMQGFFMAPAEAPHLVFALRGFQENDVGAFCLEIVAARQGLVEAVNRTRIGARHDQVSASAFASTAARIFMRASPREITCLPRVWPHFFGLT